MHLFCIICSPNADTSIKPRENAKLMQRTERLNKITHILRTQAVASQEQLLEKLARSGVAVTQASVSRDLKELGVIKVGGTYQLPHINPGDSPMLDRLSAEYAGPNLVVFKTSPGHASMLASHMDRARIPGLVGTLAGDDTIFAAVRDAKDQASVVKRVMSLIAVKAGERHAE